MAEIDELLKYRTMIEKSREKTKLWKANHSDKARVYQKKYYDEKLKAQIADSPEMKARQAGYNKKYYEKKKLQQQQQQQQQILT